MLFYRAVTSILSQRLLHKMTNSRAVLIARLRVRQTSRLSQETQYLAPILTDKLVQCIRHNINFAHWKQCSHSSWKFSSTFTEFTWPWRRTLTNWHDVKYVFPRCLLGSLSQWVLSCLAKSWPLTNVKTVLNSSFGGLTAYLKSRWPRGRKAYFRGVSITLLWNVNQPCKACGRQVSCSEATGGQQRCRHRTPRQRSWRNPLTSWSYWPRGSASGLRWVSGEVKAKKKKKTSNVIQLKSDGNRSWTRLAAEIRGFQIRGFFHCAERRVVKTSSVEKHYGCKGVKQCDLIANGRSQTYRPSVRNMTTAASQDSIMFRKRKGSGKGTLFGQCTSAFSVHTTIYHVVFER